MQLHLLRIAGHLGGRFSRTEWSRDAAETTAPMSCAIAVAAPRSISGVCAPPTRTGEPERAIKAAADVSPIDAFGGKATRKHRIRVRSQRSERLQFPALGVVGGRIE